jgi:hypothetical protein
VDQFGWRCPSVDLRSTLKEESGGHTTFEELDQDTCISPNPFRLYLSNLRKSFDTTYTCLGSAFSPP